MGLIDKIERFKKQRFKKQIIKSIIKHYCSVINLQTIGRLRGAGRGFRNPTPANYCFPPNFINVNIACNQKNWQYLMRGYDDENLIKEFIQKVCSYTMCSYDALISLASQVRYIEENNIPGAFVETGVCRGGSAALMAIASKHWGKSERYLHLFDSFEGLPRPIREYDYTDMVQNDWGIPPDDCDGRLVATGALVASQIDTEQAMFTIAAYPRALVTFYKGWFQDTVPSAINSVGQIALLRMDGDLYESTLVCLRNLYPLVIEGGFIIIDDWCLKGCRIACEQYFKEVGIKPFIHFVDGCTRYIVKE